MTVMDLATWLVLGGVAGWLGGQVLGDDRLGPARTIVLGIVGAVAAGFLAVAVGLPSGGAELADVNLLSAIVAIIGAVAVVAIASFAFGSRQTA